MTDPVARLADAERTAAAARTRLSVTLALLQEQLEPRRLARVARRELADGAQVAAQRASAAALANPGPLAGIVAAAGLFLARHRIARLFRRHPTQPAPTPHVDPRPDPKRKRSHA